jgi:hypothetical protein
MQKIDHLTREEIGSRPRLASKINLIIDTINNLIDLLERPTVKEKAVGKRSTNQKRNPGKDG